MGCSTSKHASREDAKLDKTTTFAHFAMLGDLANLQRMLTKEKMDPNAQDVSSAFDNEVTLLSISHI